MEDGKQRRRPGEAAINFNVLTGNHVPGHGQFRAEKIKVEVIINNINNYGPLNPLSQEHKEQEAVEFFPEKAPTSISKKYAAPIDSKVIAEFFKWVMEGHLVKAESLLKKYHGLATEKLTITDLSGRIFTDMTGSQYAAWALDIEMVKVISKYLDSEVALKQLMDLENHPKNYSTYGAHYDMTSLIGKTETYLDNYMNWKREKGKCEQYWQKEIGEAQQGVPAWLIYAWCEKGEKVAWTQSDFRLYSVQRAYSAKYFEWWWTNEFNGGVGVGSSWAVLRGFNDHQMQLASTTVKIRNNSSGKDEHPLKYLGREVQSLKAAQSEQLYALDELKANLDIQSESKAEEEELYLSPELPETILKSPLSASLATNSVPKLQPHPPLKPKLNTQQPVLPKKEKSSPLPQVFQPVKAINYPAADQALVSNKKIQDSPLAIQSPPRVNTKFWEGKPEFFMKSSSQDSKDSIRERAKTLESVLNQDSSPIKLGKQEITAPSGTTAMSPNVSHFSPAKVKPQAGAEAPSQAGFFSPKASASNDNKKYTTPIDPKVVTEFFKWVVEGHLLKVENLLKTHLGLATEKLNITDLSGRKFKGITGLQYAAWALDIEMARVISKRLDNLSAAEQLNDLELYPERYSDYGAHYDMASLITKTQTYLNDHGKWSVDQQEQYWLKQVGSAQGQAPAWLIYAWCEQGSTVAWTQPDNLTLSSVNREYKMNYLVKWFEYNFNIGKGVGSTWAVFRGSHHTWIPHHIKGTSVSSWIQSFFLPKVLHDVQSLEAAQRDRLDELEKLRAQLGIKNEAKTEFTLC